MIPSSWGTPVVVWTFQKQLLNLPKLEERLSKPSTDSPPKSCKVGRYCGLNALRKMVSKFGKCEKPQRMDVWSIL